MTRPPTLTLALAGAVLSLAATPRQTAQGVDRVRWLTGCWETLKGNILVKENWSAPRNGVMTETGRTTRGTTVLETETIRLFQRGGKLIYEAHPSGQASAEFTSTTVTDTTVVFTNPQRDFPKTIAYHVRGDSLFARVEGTGPHDNSVQMVDFQYRRVACAAK